MEFTVSRLDPDSRSDFYKVHSADYGHDWCFCCAWHLNSWDGFPERTAEENRSLREELMADGGYDGYLLYAYEEPVGWMQVVPRDSLPLLRKSFGLKPDPGAWALSCLFIAPDYRRKGLSERFLKLVLDDLHKRGAKRVEAYPKSGEFDPVEHWRGAESVFLRNGFAPVKETENWKVLVKELA
jgi:GNAT superfamily N-acetyltransferase